MSVHLSFVDIEDEQLPIHLSRPSTKPTAAIIVCHHALGIYQDSFLRRYCDALAQCGFLAALPDFYHRAWAATNVAESKGAGLQQGDMPVAALIRSVADQNLVRDLNGVINLLEQEGISAVGVLGFCLGGRTSWLAGCSFPDKIRSCVMYHGGNIQVPLDGGFSGFAKMALGSMVGSWCSNYVPGSGSQSPWEIRQAMRCPVLGHFGALDTNPSPKDAETFREALTQQGLVIEFHQYEGAAHGFSCADSSAYQQQGADLAWGRTLEFCCRVLGQSLPDKFPDAPGQDTAATPGNACTSGCEEIRQSKQ